MDTISISNKVQKPSTSSRKLNILCMVCGDNSSGKHYDIFACDGCAGFFKRSIRRNRKYVCLAKDENCCAIDKYGRNHCRACRFAKCKAVGMNNDVRPPRNLKMNKQQQIQSYSSSVIPTIPLPLPVQQSYRFPAVSPCNESPELMPTILHKSSILPISPVTSDLQSLNERAAKQLFKIVKWLKETSSFTALPLQDQHSLLESSWKDQFLISTSQYLNINFVDLLQSLDMTKRDEEQSTIFLKEVNNFRICIQDYHNLGLDDKEYLLFKELCIYRVSVADENEVRLINRSDVIDRFNSAHMSLHIYTRSTYPFERRRFRFIMDLLKSMDRVQSTVIEDLFFKKIIGEVSMEHVLCDMYK